MRDLLHTVLRKSIHAAIVLAGLIVLLVELVMLLVRGIVTFVAHPLATSGWLVRGLARGLVSVLEEAHNRRGA